MIKLKAQILILFTPIVWTLNKCVEFCHAHVFFKTASTDSTNSFNWLNHNRSEKQV